MWGRYDSLLERLHPMVLAGKLDSAAARTERLRRLLSSFGERVGADELADRNREFRAS
jgi:uncharacterized protein (DUF2236 family)